MEMHVSKGMPNSRKISCLRGLALANIMRSGFIGDAHLWLIFSVFLRFFGILKAKRVSKLEHTLDF
jgi:hypothetical protein